jgi:hypothetical protein
LFTQLIDFALPRAWFKAGSSMLAKIAMMAITTRSSIKVKNCLPALSLTTLLLVIFSTPF